jgi:heat shock protein HslJ
MKMIFFSLGLSAALIFLSACTASQVGNGGDLTGQVWALSKLGGNSLVAGSSITAIFSAGGKVGGSSGCNQYSGSYTTSGNTITFPTPLASTMMMCAQPVMDQETAYLKSLGDAKTYTVKGSLLRFFDGSGAILTEYNAQSQDLKATNWEVISYNNGNQAVTSVMLGTTLSANFNADGTLSGDGGCNTYSGSYKVNGNNISIGPLASTKKYCADPAGVMDQETQYLAALQTAATYQVQGNMLELRTQDGALAVQFSKK